MSAPEEEEEKEAVAARIEVKVVELSRFSSFALGCFLGLVVLCFYYLNTLPTAPKDALPTGDVHPET